MRTSIKKLKLCRFFSVEKLSVVFWLVSSGIIIAVGFSNSFRAILLSEQRLVLRQWCENGFS